MNLLNVVHRIYQQTLTTHQQALHYLYGRGLTTQTIKQFEVGFSGSYCLNGLKQNHKQALKDLGLLNDKSHERYWNRIMFPIHDHHGKRVGYNGRSLKENEEMKYLLSPEWAEFKKSKLLFNLHQAKNEIKKRNAVYIVEGVFDVMVMHQLGIKNVVCGLGASLSEEQIKLLSKETKNIIFAYDGDQAGFNASIKNAMTLSSTLTKQDEFYNFMKQTKFLMFPNGEDPGGLIKPGAYGAQKIHHMINESKTYMQYCRLNCDKNPHYEIIFKKIRTGKAIEAQIKQVSSRHTQNILKQLDIVEVVSHYVPLKKSGKDYKCHCPFHEEKTASMVVSPKKQIFKCFGCDEGGNAIKFVAQIEKISYKEALTKLSHQHDPLLKNEPSKVEEKRMKRVKQKAQSFENER